MKKCDQAVVIPLDTRRYGPGFELQANGLSLRKSSGVTWP